MLYRGVSPQAAIFGQRSSVLSGMLANDNRIVVASIRAALGLLPSPESIQTALTRIDTGDSFSPENLANKLVDQGYQRVPHVSVGGEFALRGEVLDIAPLGKQEAVRIVFSWEEVEDIRLFDPLTQASTKKIDHVVLHPMKEMNWNQETLAILEKRLGQNRADNILHELGTNREMRGEELYYPLACTPPHTLADYLPEDSIVVLLDTQSLLNNQKAMIKEYNKLYSEADWQQEPLPKPEDIVCSLDTLRQIRSSVLEVLTFRQDNIQGAEVQEILELSCSHGKTYLGDINLLRQDLIEYETGNYQISIIAESESQAQRLSYLLREHGTVQIESGILTSGFHLPEAKILVIQENEIFGRRRKAPESVRKASSSIIESFIELNPGDPIVHINHGIGLFKGIQRIRAAKTERDYITIEYQGDEIIFVPIEQVNLIQRYIGGEGNKLKLDRIGGASWSKKTNRVRKSVADLADSLILLYAKRQTSQGFAFPQDDDFQVSFEAAFPWQETEDQLLAIADVKSDMTSARPMDRLICGDVGYGKTEIAMRAAFKSILGGRQVICLAPTTILAEQHYESFTERFKRFPVSLAMLSRLVPTADQKTLLSGLKEGNIDIVIGTQRLLSSDVKLKNPGLLIIDEEQRFGVADKEKIKHIKANIDCLTLSATPIPRTLHMSLTRIRDMSLLKTPPRNRRPIETFIQEFDEELIVRAIRREAERGGQVYYLHNRIESLENVQNFLKERIPEVFTEIAHGRLSPRKLEDIMHRFIHGAFQVLVSTTIIENGIDIPNVNTIIIDRADMYGISQLYQLRGRVGRSGRLAYAYLLYPQGRQISEMAMKRLQVISDFTELGSGFKIAMKDLEIRGAGNLLGAEQSGDVQAIGFDLYLKLLDQAIRERMDKDNPDNLSEDIQETTLELEYTGYIPEKYINDASEKMEVYKRIAAVSIQEELDSLTSILFDRFGPLPEEVYSLLSIAEIRIICKKLHISTLSERRGIVQVKFAKLSMISVDKVMNLIQKNPDIIRLDNKKPDSLFIECHNIDLKHKSRVLVGFLGKLL